MAKRQISTADLAVGMYVSGLDRAWIETPFLFQGFTIQSQDEIDELARYCRHVVIDDDGPDISPCVNGTAPVQLYQDQVKIQDEAPQARVVHERASVALEDVMGKVRGGGRLELEELDTVVTPMMESVLRNQDALAWLTRIRQADDYAYSHAVSCSIYAIAFGRHLGLPKEDLQVLGLGALLLDIGKTRLPRELLNKPGPLNEREIEIVRRHVQYGVEILGGAAAVEPRVLDMVRSHHERYDGSGYPQRLKGPDIPVYARIAGIVDYYDAVTTARVYAPAISSYDAMRHLQRHARDQFQREMVDRFIQAIGMFPNGALVELSSGEVGIVVEQNRLRRLRPKILLILDEDKQPLAKIRSVDLRERASEPGLPGAIWIERGLEPGAHGIDPAEYYL